MSTRQRYPVEATKRARPPGAGPVARLRQWGAGAQRPVSRELLVQEEFRVSVHDVVRKLSQERIAQATVELLGAPIEGRDAEKHVPAMGKPLLSKRHQSRAHAPTPRGGRQTVPRRTSARDFFSPRRSVIQGSLEDMSCAHHSRSGSRARRIMSWRTVLILVHYRVARSSKTHDGEELNWILGLASRS
jgi:hypothetical protein